MTSGTHQWLTRLASMVAAWAMVACASAPPALPAAPSVPAPPAADAGGVMGMLQAVANKALETVGLKKPELPPMPQVPDSALPDWRVQWHIFASESLNVDAHGRSLALLMRVYKLKTPDAFLQAPPEAFGDTAKEKEALGDDLISVREVQIIPGQRYASLDKLPREARFLGVVALFRQPADNRWRYAFSTPDSTKSGINLGAHACALSVQEGIPIGQSLSVAKSAAVTCRP